MVSREIRWFEVTVRGPGTEHLPGERLSSSGDSTLLRVADVDALRALLSQVAQDGGEVTSVWPSRETLEDLFLREVGS
ncbi:MAG: hypothetical protein R3344_14945, partial [Acidobacteriota bacterium]|nr:hypothetical protein [Acidobacteriota bacterium]